MDPKRLETLKREAVAEVDRMATFTQQAVDMVFSFGELGFQEIETSKYLTGLLRTAGFTVTEGVAGIPTAWVATWGSGKPVIALGSDIDGIPQASQKPGVAYREALVEGAPGHGEGHNSGQPLNITAAIAIKKIMERDHLSGTIKVWPGVAEEQLAGKAPLVRAGVFCDVDVCIFTHVGDNFDVSWGAQDGTGLISAQFDFLGEASHAAGAPWRGRSALDAVELMDIGWNFRREHLRQQTRVHYVIRDGGDQPNVVPRTASVWYYFRETTPARIRELFELGQHDGDRGRPDGERQGRQCADHRLGLAQLLQPAGGARGLQERSDRGAADLVGGRPGPGEGAADRAQGPGQRTRHQDLRPARAGARFAESWAAVRTTSATWPGASPRCTSRIRPTFPIRPGTAGRARSRWPRRSRTRARPPARRWWR